MAGECRTQDDQRQIERLTRELEEAELFAQRLRSYIAGIRDEVAGGHAGRALSLCNQALTEIDNAAEVVAPSPGLKSSAADPAAVDGTGGDERD